MMRLVNTDIILYQKHRDCVIDVCWRRALTDRGDVA
jgi:hypothetical protein